MKVYVTGVAGFLGSHIAGRHLKAGDIVCGCDNFLSSREDSEHLRDLRARGLMFTQHDVQSSSFQSTMLFHDFDIVYNMACIASPPLYQRMPVSTMLTSVVGLNNVLNAAAVRAASGRSMRVVHASTSEVYGDPQLSPQRETDAGHVHSWGPRSCYDSGKMAAEALCHDYLNQGVDVRVVRIFNTYGPHMLMNDGRVVTNFVKQALRGDDITIYGSGLQTRSFCYVDDLINGIIALGALDSNPRTPVNIGNPGEFTIKQLAELVIEKIPETGSRLNVMVDSLPMHDPQQRRPDITQAKRLLGWAPKVSLTEGLDRFISYARRQRT